MESYSCALQAEFRCVRFDVRVEPRYSNESQLLAIISLVCRRLLGPWPFNPVDSLTLITFVSFVAPLLASSWISFEGGSYASIESQHLSSSRAMETNVDCWAVGCGPAGKIMLKEHWSGCCVWSIVDLEHPLQHRSRFLRRAFHVDSTSRLMFVENQCNLQCTVVYFVLQEIRGT